MMHKIQLNSVTETHAGQRPLMSQTVCYPLNQSLTKAASF